MDHQSPMIFLILILDNVTTLMAIRLYFKSCDNKTFQLLSIKSFWINLKKGVLISENEIEIVFDTLLKIKTITNNSVNSVSEYMYYINIILKELIQI